MSQSESAGPLRLWHACAEARNPGFENLMCEGFAAQQITRSICCRVRWSGQEAETTAASNLIPFPSRSILVAAGQLRKKPGSLNEKKCWNDFGSCMMHKNGISIAQHFTFTELYIIIDRFKKQFPVS